MKPINILSLLQAKQSLQEDAFNDYLNHFGISIRAGEIEDIKALAEALIGVGCSTDAFDSFYVGYKIPQIGKEFDLLRFGAQSIVNVELKASSSPEKIKKQLLRNKYYLGFLGRPVKLFTFVSASKVLYTLDDDEHLEIVESAGLGEWLTKQQVDDIQRLDELFNPSDYLVSPFNATDRFLKGEYFLTHQQEEVRNQIIASILASKATRFFSISGNAGTGKTLLAYDIGRSLIDDMRKVLVIHCGQLNNGHDELKRNGWSVVPITYYQHCDFSKYDLVIVDEAQRLRLNQLEDIVERIGKAMCSCIFSHDRLQTLAAGEKARNLSARIGSIKSIVSYNLSDKIRTNKEIADFIKMLFNNKKTFPLSNSGNIRVNYFNTDQSAKAYLDGLSELKWKVLRFTPSQYDNEHHEKYSGVQYPTSHRVIGQEFDAVAVPIDDYFSYGENGDLVYKGKAYYDPPSMLFQNITRTRKKLNLVIINNAELLARCLAILR
ncbi:DNA/RNA helicase domain-containing protein [Caballeronia arationis]|uniref:DNA/RNA helicase domain-containing protein n=1 Tax=Caballeronia arationis TaxID=1777142 RepID=UPI00135C7227|nr:DNA/RNA helicase domain-containing protein [Caballeronia arationis]